MNPIIYAQRPFAGDILPSSSSGKVMRHETVTSSHIDAVIKGIEKVNKFYDNSNYLEKIILSIFYKGITSKSYRVSELFCSKNQNSFSSMLGSIYENVDTGDETQYRHVVTHYLPKSILDEAIYNLTFCKEIVDIYFNGTFTKEDMNKVRKNDIQIVFDKKKIGKTKFLNVIRDVSEIDKIDILITDVKDNKIISLYPCFDSTTSLKKFLLEIGISKYVVLNSSNIILDDAEKAILIDRAPYIVSCGTDMSIEPTEDIVEESDTIEDKLPKKDINRFPTIGVFDSFTEKKTFYSEYVEEHNLLSKTIIPLDRDYYHGTKIDSILIMGHLLNPYLDDGCGFFRVKHFVVGTEKWIDFETLYKSLERIISDNCDEVKVWNMSLGDIYGVNPNYISILGEKLDELSRKYNVLFVVAGTNIDKKTKDTTIGCPADSFNAIVVNAVDDDDNIPSYARKGPVLTFVQKPDISYYGGTEEKPLIGYSSDYRRYKCFGTSIAAPYISRKCAYLIHKARVPVQCAKAMIVDSAFKWGDDPKQRHYLGYGIVPIHIDNIINSPRDEIKIVMHGHTMNQHTYIADFPILLENGNKFNYRTKVVFCYFTYGSRNQGVDYADQDISVSIGHAYFKPYKNAMNEYQSHLTVDNIEKMPGMKSGAYYDQYGKEIKRIIDQGKWNNTKIVMEKARKSAVEYQKNEEWGIVINHLDRHESVSKLNWLVNEDNTPAKDSASVSFGMVITFKTIDGTDARYDDFIRCIGNNKNYILTKIEKPIENILQNQEAKRLKIRKDEE